MNAKQYYYVDRNGNLQCRIVEPSRRRHRIRVKSPVKLGGILAVLTAVGGMTALLFGGEPAPVSQLARVEVAAAPLPAAGTDEGVSADDIGEALWADFVDPTPEPAAPAAEEAPAAEIEAKDAAEPEGEAVAVEDIAQEAPADETAAEEAEEAAQPEGEDDSTAKDIAAEEIEGEADAEEAPAGEAVAEGNAQEASADEAAAEDDAGEAVQEPIGEAEPAADAPVTAMKAPAAASRDIPAMEVPMDEHLGVRTIPSATSEEDEFEWVD